MGVGDVVGDPQEFFKPYKMKGEPKLIFSDEFNTFDHDLWKHTIQGEDFVAYVNNRTNSFV